MERSIFTFTFLLILLSIQYMDASSDASSDFLTFDSEVIPNLNALKIDGEENFALSDTLWRVELLNGNEFIGTIQKRTSEKIDLFTQSLGLISIPIKEIRFMEPVSSDKIKDGKFFFDNPQATRYFFAPNGYGLKKGEAYYQNIWVFWNQASVGVTDYFSIGGGMIPLPLLLGESFVPVWITPKVSIPISPDQVNLGLGVLAGGIIGEENVGVGIAYGISTFGNKNNNVTIGLGYGYADGDWAETPAVTLAGMFRVGERGYILSENYYIDEVGILSFGGRHIWNRLAIDYGVAIPIFYGEVIGIPWLGISIPLGQLRKG